jgi:Zinc carboxypeptidase
MMLAALAATVITVTSSAHQTTASGLMFIDTSVENGSPLWYDIVDDVIQLHLLYDHERASPNRAAGHIHFVLHATAGASLTLEFRNLDNVWNGQPVSVAGELKSVAISEDGQTWKTVPTESLPGNRVQLRVTMSGPTLHVARMQPYRLSDLDRLLGSIKSHRLVRIESIGKTVAGRQLEIVRIGNPAAPDRVFVRARAHPWEAGSNWVAQGLINRLLAGDDEAARFLRVYNVSILPMANKDGVARGGTRFNLRGVDLNRGWDRPADPDVSPENAALERWLEREIASGRKPHLALELHNDGNGRLHISRPPVPQLSQHLARMTIFEELLRKHTWFTEGTTSPDFRNSGTLGDGWLQRYGIDAAVHEFNRNWIAGLKEPTSSRRWMEYGAGLARVFHDYFFTLRAAPSPDRAAQRDGPATTRRGPPRLRGPQSRLRM